MQGAPSGALFAYSGLLAGFLALADTKHGEPSKNRTAALYRMAALKICPWLRRKPTKRGYGACPRRKRYLDMPRRFGVRKNAA
jgi:hypothetical protein